jgi:hypothetical protein
MIRFFKELYLTGFALIFKSSHASGRTAGAVTIVALIEWLILGGISSWIDIFMGTRFLLSNTNSLASSKLAILFLFFALYLANYHILVTRDHGIRFARGFDNLAKSRRILLVISFWGLILATITFFICSRLAYQHFFHL